MIGEGDVVPVADLSPYGRQIVRNGGAEGFGLGFFRFCLDRFALYCGINAEANASPLLFRRVLTFARSRATSHLISGHLPSGSLLVFPLTWYWRI